MDTIQHLGQSGDETQQGYDIFLFATIYQLAVGPTQPPTQWILIAVSPRIK
jgi:hypothetical protein